MNGKNARTRLILQLERIIASQFHQKNLMGGKNIGNRFSILETVCHINVLAMEQLTLMIQE
ncbi:MAG: hypothetical protein J6I76_20630 [Oribacterium sp.]|nr:hypothetical protein [Oribacterium sp.]